MKMIQIFRQRPTATDTCNTSLTSGLRFYIIVNCFLFYRDDDMLISKAVYKKLVDQSIELAQLKSKFPKADDALKTKSNELKKLRRKNRALETMLQTQREKVMENQSVTDDEQANHDADVRNYIAALGLLMNLYWWRALSQDTYSTFIKIYYT